MSTVHFEYDPERLIEEVKKRRGLWDVEDMDYRSKQARYRLWTEIVRELMAADGDIKLSKSDMRELELQLQKKWKSIRDCYQKYRNNKKKTRRPYIYYKNLEFLHNTGQNKSHQDQSSESDEGRTKQIWKTKKKFKIRRDSTDDENLDDIKSNENTEALMEVPAKHSGGHTTNTLDDFVFANVESKSEYEDSDKMFLLSLLPYLKAVPDEYRLNVKMDLMQVLRNASYNINEQKHIL